MNQKASLSHLFRPFNLLIIGLTMYFLRWGFLKPMLRFTSDLVDLELVSQISELWFGLLVLSVLLIAVGGYIINDYKDVEVDKLNNRPNPVGVLITEETTYKLYQITTVLGLVLGFFVGYELGNYNYGIIQLTAAISLWFYSYYFKTEFLLGNLIVAFVIALVPLTVGIYEVTLLQINYFQKVKILVDFNFNFIAFWFMAYALFAFVLTFIREVLKDVEDIEGDQKIGARTLPIQYGVKVSNILATLLYAGVIYGLIYAQTHFITDSISLSFVAIIIGLILINIGAIWSGGKLIFSASTWNKIISLIGVFYLLALGYIINNQLFF